MTGKTYNHTFTHFEKSSFLSKYDDSEKTKIAIEGKKKVLILNLYI
jgi:hypothetical protein